MRGGFGSEVLGGVPGAVVDPLATSDEPEVGVAAPPDSAPETSPLTPPVGRNAVPILRTSSARASTIVPAASGARRSRVRGLAAAAATVGERMDAAPAGLSLAGAAELERGVAATAAVAATTAGGESAIEGGPAGGGDVTGEGTGSGGVAPGIGAAAASSGGAVPEGIAPATTAALPAAAAAAAAFLGATAAAP